MLSKKPFPLRILFFYHKNLKAKLNSLKMTEANPPKAPVWIIPTIVFSQFAGTSLWFAGNAVLGDLQVYLKLTGDQVLGSITSSDRKSVV